MAMADEVEAGSGLSEDGSCLSERIKSDESHVVGSLVKAVLAMWAWLVVKFVVGEVRLALRKLEGNMELKFTWQELFRYRVEQHFSTSKWAKPALLLTATSALILVGGGMLGLVEAAEGASDSAWVAWTYVADPGTHADAEGSLVRLVSLSITIGGMLVFALMIGIISDEISEKVDDLKEGRSRVIESNHTLMLGWSDKSLAIIEQIALANESEAGGHIVVLADRPKTEMEQRLLHATESTENPLHLRGTSVVFRAGNPLLEHELSKVSVTTARAIIVLSPADLTPDEADSTMVRQVLALKTCDNVHAHVVVEMQDIDNKALVTMVAPDNVEVVVAHDIIGRLMIQCAREPGLAHVLESLLGFDGDEFYFDSWAGLVGCTFLQITCRFDDAVPIGVKRASDSRIDINPPNDYVIQPGDQILCLAEDNDTYTVNDASFYQQINKDKLKVASLAIPMRGKEKLLFCGWRRDMADMIVQLDEYCSPDSELWLFNQVPADQRVELLKDKDNKDEVQTKNLAIKNVVGNPIVRRHLKSLNALDNHGHPLNEVSTVDEFDSILILSDMEGNDIANSDSRSIATLLIIQDIQRQLAKEKAKSNNNNNNKKQTQTTDIATTNGGTNKKNTRVISDNAFCSPISEILDTRTRSLLSVAGCKGYVMSNHIVSQWMAQVAEDRNMNSVLSELLSADGCETYIRSISHYINVSPSNSSKQRTKSFWEIALLARQRREVAIGYKPHGMEWAESTDLILNPPNKMVPRVWDEEDVLLIIAFD